jgi:hypothetical protein
MSATVKLTPYRPDFATQIDKAEDRAEDLMRENRDVPKQLAESALQHEAMSEKDVFGLCKYNGMDGVAYQQAIRLEWQATLQRD